MGCLLKVLLDQVLEVYPVPGHYVQAYAEIGQECIKEVVKTKPNRISVCHFLVDYYYLRALTTRLCKVFSRVPGIELQASTNGRGARHQSTLVIPISALEWDG